MQCMRVPTVERFYAHDGFILIPVSGESRTLPSCPVPGNQPST